MKTNLLPILLIIFSVCTRIGFAQVAFSDSSSALVNSSLNSGVAMGVADMNGDGLDDIIRLSGASNLEIEYQGANGVWTNYVFGNTGPGSEWSMCISDVDKNGFNDVLVGGAFNNLKLLKANANGTGLISSTLPTPIIFLQGSNFADINNDGDIDIFACHDVGLSSAYANDGSGDFTYDLGLINTSSTIPSDNSGNYGSTWTDYDGDGDLDMYLSKCRLGVGNELDGRRVNMLFQNDGNNNFTDVAEAAGLRPLAQSWAADFSDIDNDGDLDAFIINHDIPSQLYVNNGDGTFTDITIGSGLEAELIPIGLGIQCKFEDFDNDGFVDLLVTGRSGDHGLFWNNGNSTFTFSDPFETGGDGIQSAAVGDLNHDGFIDIIAGFANGFNSPSSNSDRYFQNGGNANNFFNLQLTGVESNINGVAALVEIYGPWGKQIREVRAGESYGVCNSFTVHFGLGAASEIDHVIVRWPSGLVDLITAPEINIFFQLTEGTLEVDCPILGANIGDACDDGDPDSDNDIITPECDCLGTLTAPSNDLCENAQELTVYPPDGCPENQTIGTTIGATDQFGSYSCDVAGGPHPDVFYSFNSGNFDEVVIELSSISQFDMVIGVGTICGGDDIHCSNSFGLKFVTVEPNTDYIIRLAPNLFFGVEGEFVICISGVYSCPSLDANIGDACDDGDPLTENDTVTPDCNCEGTVIPVANVSLLTLECGGEVIQLTGAQSGPNGGGTATSDTRTIYAFAPDGGGDVPTYNGGAWPYVVIPGALVIDPSVSAVLTTNDDGVLLVNGRPAYQYVGDPTSEDANGTFGPWSYFLANGDQSQDACPIVWECPVLELNIGDACDDGDPNTINDAVDVDCNCAGEPLTGSLSGTADWNSNCGERDLTVDLYTPGTAALLYSFTTTIDANGDFDLGGLIAVGNYDIYAKLDGRLANSYDNQSISVGANTLLLGSFIPGDLDNNNGINISDFSLLNVSFGSSEGAANFNFLADMNCDGNVNIIDVSILNIGFGMTGDSPGTL